MPKPGEIWVAEIPFTNGSASKLRPVLILWIDGRDAVVAAVTSAPSRRSTDVILKEWTAAGLRVASTVRLSRLDCLEQSLFRKRLGFLAETDRNETKRIWSSEIRLVF
jgi:mRNA interferase MazF